MCGALPAYEVLQDGALARALTAHHHDLRQVNAAGLAHAAHHILQPVDQRDQLLHPVVAHRNGAVLLPVAL